MKWGVNFCNDVREIKILFQYLRDKKKKRKKGAQKKGGENSPISPPLDPRLPYFRENSNTLVSLRMVICNLEKNLSPEKESLEACKNLTSKVCQLN